MPRVLPSRHEQREDPRVVRLLGLLLVDALQTLAQGRNASGARETRQWVCATDANVYSFENACEAFNLPPRALRRRLGLRAAGVRRVSKRGWMRGPSR
jgi:hypothetical protein